MKNDHRSELCDRFISATTDLYRLVYKGLVDDRKGPIGLFPQYRTVMLLANEGPLRVSQIAHHLGCTPSAVTYTLNRLIEKKLVKRVSYPQDRRVVICELAYEGRKLLNRVNRDVRERVLAATGTWSLEQFEAVVEAMESANSAR